jgi:hypothetical protein
MFSKIFFKIFFKRLYFHIVEDRKTFLNWTDPRNLDTGLSKIWQWIPAELSDKIEAYAEQKTKKETLQPV